MDNSIAKIQMLLLLLLLLAAGGQAMSISSGHCQKNVTSQYKLPVLSSNEAGEPQIVYEDRIRSDTVNICCPGYSSTFFGLCQPICESGCPANSYCSGPNKCACNRGYEPSHHHSNKHHQLICRPVCLGGCPEHSHCVGVGRCECRPGYHDVSCWFTGRVECQRIPCPPDQRYDPELRGCVPLASMSMEELMQQVAARLVKGLRPDDTLPASTERAELDHERIE